MEEFIYNLREHIIGLNLGRWDYMASLIHFNLKTRIGFCRIETRFRTTLPFFQKLRKLMVEICHKHGILAIGGMTALFPSRADAELNERALKVLEIDKKNEASVGWTARGQVIRTRTKSPSRNFPFRIRNLRASTGTPRYPDLRPGPEDVGKRTFRRNARRGAHSNSLSQRRFERQRRVVCWTVIWKTWRQTEFIV